MNKLWVFFSIQSNMQWWRMRELHVIFFPLYFICNNLTNKRKNILCNSLGLAKRIRVCSENKPQRTMHFKYIIHIFYLTYIIYIFSKNTFVTNKGKNIMCNSLMHDNRIWCSHWKKLSEKYAFKTYTFLF